MVQKVVQQQHLLLCPPPNKKTCAFRFSMFFLPIHQIPAPFIIGTSLFMFAPSARSGWPNRAHHLKKLEMELQSEDSSKKTSGFLVQWLFCASHKRWQKSVAFFIPQWRQEKYHLYTTKKSDCLLVGKNQPLILFQDAPWDWHIFGPRCASHKGRCFFFGFNRDFPY